jgi:hypothetical protein
MRRAADPKAEVIKALKEAQELLKLCGPSAFRAKALAERLLPEDPLVLDLCEHHGFGAVMDSAARQWALRSGLRGHNHTTGPAGASVERGLKMIRSALRHARRL